MPEKIAAVAYQLEALRLEIRAASRRRSDDDNDANYYEVKADRAAGEAGRILDA